MEETLIADAESILYGITMYTLLKNVVPNAGVNHGVLNGFGIMKILD